MDMMRAHFHIGFYGKETLASSKVKVSGKITLFIKANHMGLVEDLESCSDDKKNLKCGHIFVSHL